MENVSVLAITRNGIKMGADLKKSFPDWHVLAPEKFSDGDDRITWYSESTTQKIAELFHGSDALVCIFSLGAVIRLIAPYLKSKKTDPAIIVIDDQGGFVISALSGHIGGANELTLKVAARIGATPVITTAADVNKTISVDLIGRKLGWQIEDDSAVTRVSAHMVNGDPIGVFQDTGSRKWYTKLPQNVTIYGDMDSLRESGSKGHIVISDWMIEGAIPADSVVYRPPSLVIGVGLHWDTPKDTIKDGIAHTLEKFGLSPVSVSGLASIKKPQDVPGLTQAALEMNIPVEYVDRKNLAQIQTPNPSDTVRSFEGTASVSEAAAMISAGGNLVVEKQKFPPNLTIAIARRMD